MANETEFEVPEDDGINSGHPVDVSSAEAAAAKARIASGTRRDKLEHGQESISQKTLQGLSIKAKLLGGFSILTLIIALLGWFFYGTVVELNEVSNLIAQEQVRLAKLTGEIKSSVYRIRDAEKDFMLLEEEEALNRVVRESTSLSDRISAALVLGDSIETSSGIQIGSQYVRMKALAQQYTDQFEQQVKDTKSARAAIDQDLANVIDLKQQLLVLVEANRSLVSNITDDYWLELKKTNLNKATTSREINLGVKLNGMEKELLNIQIQAAKYLDTENQKFAAATRFYITSTINIANEVRASAVDEKLQLQLVQTVKNLKNYELSFQEANDNVVNVNNKKSAIDLKIDAQKEDLKKVGQQLLIVSTELSERSWSSIDSMSKKLLMIGSAGKNNLLILSVASVALGIILLIFVPKPILSAIAQILTAAQQVASGDLTQQVSVANRDELGHLAVTFDSMRLNLRQLVERTQAASVQISSSVNEIQAAANQQSSTANEQAATVNELSATLNEISATTTKLSSAIKDTNSFSEQARSHAQASSDKSAQLLESMSLINESTGSTSARIKALNDQMDSINDAVGIIANVADQTTLLSMNASIEANKAGEAGKGFTVVAYEIRRLSERAIDSATDISSKIRDIQRATENSVVAMDKSSEEIRIGIDHVKVSTQTLNDINNAVGQVSQQIGEIDTAVQDQASASSQVQQTSVELGNTSKMVNQAARSTAAASYELSAMANQLADSVAKFRT